MSDPSETEEFRRTYPPGLAPKTGPTPHDWENLPGGMGFPLTCKRCGAQLWGWIGYVPPCPGAQESRAKLGGKGS